jgi:hypothetical protein
MVPTLHHSFAALLSVLTTCAAISMTPKGQTIEVNGNTYYIPPTVVTTLKIPGNQFGQNSESSDTLAPLTVIQTDSLKLTVSAVESIIEGYQKVDDVFNTRFLESRFLLMERTFLRGYSLNESTFSQIFISLIMAVRSRITTFRLHRAGGTSSWGSPRHMAPNNQRQLPKVFHRDHTFSTPRPAMSFRRIFCTLM